MRNFYQHKVTVNNFISYCLILFSYLEIENFE